MSSPIVQPAKDKVDIAHKPRKTIRSKPIIHTELGYTWSSPNHSVTCSLVLQCAHVSWDWQKKMGTVANPVVEQPSSETTLNQVKALLEVLTNTYCERPRLRPAFIGCWAKPTWMGGVVLLPLKMEVRLIIFSPLD